VSILDGIRRKVGLSTNVLYAKGCPRTDADYVTVPADFLSSTLHDTVQTGLVGSYFDNVTLSGTPVLSRVDRQIQFQWTLFSPDPARLPYDFYSVRWTGKLRGPGTGAYKIGVDGNDGYRLYLNDSLLIDNWHKISRRTLVTDYYFEKEKLYDIRIEFFEPSGNAWFRLVWNAGLPLHADSAMAAAVDIASRSDAAIVVVGIDEGEFRDRTNLALPGRQEELIERVGATGTPVVVVLVGGSAIIMKSWLASTPAVLDVWYAGEAGGEAVAEILFGDYSPAGRLPITFPVAEGQLPLVYNHKPTGRGMIMSTLPVSRSFRSVRLELYHI